MLEEKIHMRDHRSGFTLVEMLVCMTLIGILIAIGVPHYRQAIQRGLKMEDQGKLRQIYNQWIDFHTLGLLDESGCESMQDFALKMARETPLKDVLIWESSVTQTREQRRQSNQKENESIISSSYFKVDLEMATQLDFSSPPSTTPLFWTRGLLPSGEWSKDSPYGCNGGMICFLDGHIVQYDNLKRKRLHNFLDPLRYTTDIREAIPPKSRILKSMWSH